MANVSYSWKKAGVARLNASHKALLIFLDDGRTLSLYVGDVFDLANNILCRADVSEGMKNQDVTKEGVEKCSTL